MSSCKQVFQYSEWTDSDCVVDYCNYELYSYSVRVNHAVHFNSRRNYPRVRVFLKAVYHLIGFLYPFFRFMMQELKVIGEE